MTLTMKLMQLSGLTRSITTRTSLFVALNLIDLGLTVVMVNAGVGIEANPLLAGPIWRLITVKLVVVSLVVCLLSGRVGVMRLLNVGLTVVVGWNMFWFVVML